MSKITKLARNINFLDGFYYQNQWHTALESAKAPDDNDFVVIKAARNKDAKRTYIMIKKNESLEIHKN